MLTDYSKLTDFSKFHTLTCQCVAMACSCCSGDSRAPAILEHLCLLRMTYAHRRRQRRCKDATLLCEAQTVSRWIVNTSPRGKRPWPRAGFESRKGNCFRLLTFPLSYAPSSSFLHSHPHVFSSVKCQKTWHLTVLAATQKTRRGKKAVPPS